MSPDAIRALLDAFERSDWREMVVEVGEDRLHVSRDELTALAPAAAAPAPAPAPPTAPATPAGGTAGGTPPEEASATGRGGGSPAVTGPAAGGTPVDQDILASGTQIESPSVGLFWRSPSPGAPPFVEVGGRVAAGDTVAIVEVMKLMNHVAAPVDGVVTAILVENGASVEYGQTIVIVDPES